MLIEGRPHVHHDLSTRGPPRRPPSFSSSPPGKSYTFVSCDISKNTFVSPHDLVLLDRPPTSTPYSRVATLTPPPPAHIRKGQGGVYSGYCVP